MTPPSTALLKIRVLIEEVEGQYAARSLDTKTEATAPDIPALRAQFAMTLEEQLFKVARRRSSGGTFVVSVDPRLSRRWVLAAAGSVAEVFLRSEASTVVVFANAKKPASTTDHGQIVTKSEQVKC